MNKTGQLKAIFFDAGGTLFRPFPSVGGLYANTAEKFGAKLDPAALEAGFHAAWDKRGGLASLGDRTNEKKERDWWYDLVKEVLDSCGKIDRYDEFFSALYDSFERKESWEIFPEVWETLDDVRAKGLVLGLISNWDLRLHRVLKSLNLENRFDFILGSSHFGATKPSPKIFHEALRLAKCRPEEAIHVGDSYEDDFLGAQAVGIKPFLIDRSGRWNFGPASPELPLRPRSEACQRGEPKEFCIRSLVELKERIG